ncbi:uncharacterized protein LOC106373009 [Brassica napus]|uniref:uncharacterized protein LOC106373009 n=1 Tax=Brassica napus TaxID=3708 RepID=UPI00207859D6|nr:uncharacterized protein LOC106373009 [Brassica napus]
MGEAKILVEMELDKTFPKLISCDDKQGNIYLVEVEYTWIPSTCVRCGQLGHKEKRCLLPACFTKATSEPIEVQEDGSNVPMVSIDQFGSNDSSPKPTPSQDNSATIGSIPTTHVDVSDALEKMNDAQEEMRSTTREAATLQVEDLSPVKEVPLSHSKQTFSPLVENSSTPVSETIMEETPSTMVITVVNNPEDDALIDPHLPMFDRSQECEPTTHLNTTRRGRSIKPTQKVQKMGWTLVKGRGKHISRGRGNRKS